MEQINEKKKKNWKSNWTIMKPNVDLEWKWKKK